MFAAHKDIDACSIILNLIGEELALKALLLKDFVILRQFIGSEDEWFVRYYLNSKFTEDQKKLALDEFENYGLDFAFEPSLEYTLDLDALSLLPGSDTDDYSLDPALLGTTDIDE